MMKIHSNIPYQRPDAISSDIKTVPRFMYSNSLLFLPTFTYLYNRLIFYVCLKENLLQNLQDIDSIFKGVQL